MNSRTPVEPPTPPLILAESVPLPPLSDACRHPAAPPTLRASAGSLHLVWGTTAGTTCWIRRDAWGRTEAEEELAFSTIAFGVMAGQPVFVAARGGTAVCVGWRPRCRRVGPETVRRATVGPGGVLLDYGDAFAVVDPRSRGRTTQQHPPRYVRGAFWDRAAGPCGERWVMLAGTPGEPLRSLQTYLPWGPPGLITETPRFGLTLGAERTFAVERRRVTDLCTGVRSSRVSRLPRRSRVLRAYEGRVVGLLRFDPDRPNPYVYERGQREHRFRSPRQAESWILASAIGPDGSLWLAVARDEQPAALERWVSAEGASSE